MPENFERGPTSPSPEVTPEPAQEGATPEIGGEDDLGEGPDVEVGLETEEQLEKPEAETRLEENRDEKPAEGEIGDIGEETRGELQEEEGKEKGAQQEKSEENEEKRRRLEEIREKVATGFESAKGRMEAIEQRYDGLFQRGRETLAFFKEKYPNLVSDAGLERLDDANARVKDRFGKMQSLYDSGSAKLQSSIQSLPAEFLSKEHIEMIDMHIDHVFEMVNRGGDMIEERLDVVEMCVNALPPMPQEGQASENEAKKAAEELRGSDLLDEESEEGASLGSKT